MKTRFVVLALVVTAGLAQATTPPPPEAPSAAASAAKTRTHTREELRACHDSAAAKGLKGADRKAFLSECLAASGPK